MVELLLGSNSPRRAQLLSEMGYVYSRVRIDCKESFDEAMPLEEVASYLAQKKSKAYKLLGPNQVLITADTVVIIQDRILNKPEDKAEAILMLKSMSGGSHLVQTGLCLRSIEKTVTTSVTTKVYIDDLTETEIEYYVSKYKPFDKAGSYGIQEWFGLTRVNRIEGCYYNVMGLPCNELYKRLKNDYDT